MPNSIRIVSASLSNDQRALLLRQFYPRFDNVYCVQITWAYNVPQDFIYPRQMLDLTITGHHIGDGHEALVGHLTDPANPSETLLRPDGKPTHLTLCTAPGIPPARAGEIDPENVVAVAPLSLRLRLHSRIASKIIPTPRSRLAA